MQYSQNSLDELYPSSLTPSLKMWVLTDWTVLTNLNFQANQLPVMKSAYWAPLTENPAESWVPLNFPSVAVLWKPFLKFVSPSSIKSSLNLVPDISNPVHLWRAAQSILSVLDLILHVKIWKVYLKLIEEIVGSCDHHCDMWLSSWWDFHWFFQVPMCIWHI